MAELNGNKTNVIVFPDATKMKHRPSHVPPEVIYAGKDSVDAMNQEIVSNGGKLLKTKEPLEDVFNKVWLATWEYDIRQTVKSVVEKYELEKSTREIKGGSRMSGLTKVRTYKGLSNEVAVFKSGKNERTKAQTLALADRLNKEIQENGKLVVEEDKIFDRIAQERIAQEGGL